MAPWILAIATIAAAAQHTRPGPERVYRYEVQDIAVAPIAAEGYILDIGGGGEGVIGQLHPKQVVAIDLIKRELEDAPPGPLKIVMDARDLKFLDRSFHTVTAFFSLMYMKEPDHEKVFQKVSRVLAPGGRFLIWDVIISTREDPAKDVAMFPFRFRLPGKEVTTGYGTFYPERPHGLAYYSALAAKSGFAVVGKREEGRTFHLELRKQ